MQLNLKIHSADTQMFTRTITLKNTVVVLNQYFSICAHQRLILQFCTSLFCYCSSFQLLLLSLSFFMKIVLANSLFTVQCINFFLHNKMMIEIVCMYFKVVIKTVSLNVICSRKRLLLTLTHTYQKQGLTSVHNRSHISMKIYEPNQ